MIVYPAIHMRRGKVVRLVHGDPKQETSFSNDAAATARRWAEQGASWLHVVNLDGALIGRGVPNFAALQELIDATSVSVQFGGGIRDISHVQRVLGMGVSRVILGTAAVNDLNLAGEALQSFGAERIAFALDERDGQVVTHGWQQSSNWTPLALGLELAELGAVHVLHTDISRDGTMSGLNAQASADLAEATGLRVAASGGVGSLDDIVAARDAHGHIDSIVIGTALYMEIFTLAHAIRLANK